MRSTTSMLRAWWRRPRPQSKRVRTGLGAGSVMPTSLASALAAARLRDALGAPRRSSRIELGAHRLLAQRALPSPPGVVAAIHHPDALERTRWVANAALACWRLVLRRSHRGRQHHLSRRRRLSWQRARLGHGAYAPTPLRWPQQSARHPAHGRHRRRASRAFRISDGPILGLSHGGGRGVFLRLRLRVRPPDAQGGTHLPVEPHNRPIAEGLVGARQRALSSPAWPGVSSYHWT